MVRRWVRRGAEGPAPRSLVDAVADLRLPCAPFVAELLWKREISDGDAAVAFLRPSLAHGLRAPSLLHDMERATRRLAEAVTAGERIAVYGDYDVDGMTGAAQLMVFLRAVGADALLHVSHRGREGYGLHAGTLTALRSAGATVVVTADCGTADVAQLQLAADIGLDVIVCDHHHAPATRPPAFALLNPRQPECRFPFKGLSGAGVVFYLLMGLRAELRARGYPALPDLRPYLDLVALGTVADVVPLREENRVLVAHGLRALEQTTRPGLIALKETALVDRASVRAIGFRLAPRLNAGGRLAEARTAVDMLTTEDPEVARTLATELEMHNAERRAIEDTMVAEALAMVVPDDGAGDVRTTVVASDGWHPGVVGIVAARLAERYHRPALVIALDGDRGRGSGRSVRGIDLHGALVDCGDLLEGFGGHRQAVGLSLRREQVAPLASRFEESVRRRTTPADLEAVIEIDAETPFGMVNHALAEAAAALEPYGPGNPEPVLLARDVGVDGLRLVGDPARPHLRLRLRQDGRTLPAIGFGLGRVPLRVGDRIDVLFTPRLSRWQGLERLELELRDLRPSTSEDGV